jgi:hypothetical protein
VNNTYFINSNEASFFMHLKQTFNPVRVHIVMSQETTRVRGV